MDLHTPVTVLVERDGEYKVSIFAIREEIGILGFVEYRTVAVIVNSSKHTITPAISTQGDSPKISNGLAVIIIAGGSTGGLGFIVITLVVICVIVRCANLCHTRHKEHSWELNAYSTREGVQEDAARMSSTVAAPTVLTPNTMDDSTLQAGYYSLVTADTDTGYDPTLYDQVTIKTGHYPPLYDDVMPEHKEEISCDDDDDEEEDMNAADNVSTVASHDVGVVQYSHLNHSRCANTNGDNYFQLNHSANTKHETKDSQWDFDLPSYSTISRLQLQLEEDGEGVKKNSDSLTASQYSLLTCPSNQDAASNRSPFCYASIARSGNKQDDVVPTNTSDTEVSRKKDVYAAEEHPNPTTDNDMSPIADGPAIYATVDVSKKRRLKHQQRH